MISSVETILHGFAFKRLFHPIVILLLISTAAVVCAGQDNKARLLPEEIAKEQNLKNALSNSRDHTNDAAVPKERSDRPAEGEAAQLEKHPPVASRADTDAANSATGTFDAFEGHKNERPATLHRRDDKPIKVDIPKEWLQQALNPPNNNP